AHTYRGLDAKLMRGVESAKTLGLNAVGLESKVYRHGFIPEHVFDDIAKRQPNNAEFLKTVEANRRLNTLVREHREARLTRERTEAKPVQEGTGAREVSDAQGKETDGIVVRTEGQKPIGNPEVDLAYDYTGAIRQFYKEVHGRNSIDGKGMTMKSTVNYGENFENAFWNGVRMTYGKPGPQSPFRTFMQRVIAGHEVTHGVTEFEAGTVYRNQPGALNEHFSDVGGALIDMHADKLTAAQYHWLIGKGIWKDNINGVALRSMKEPGTAYNDPSIGKDIQPGHMKDFVKTTRDNGGVHINSGIPNKAFYEFATNVGGNAWEAPGKIWFEARARAGSTPQFSQFAFETVEAAKRLGHSDLVPKLEKAWSDVGVKAVETPFWHHRNFVPIFSGFGGVTGAESVNIGNQATTVNPNFKAQVMAPGR
ncbi:MAG TPA: M4 family metallopeptidase, partial [Candidatus Melainabacteria bacterium]|nr:M4 family metallopeptidase [Candidatus Melainabacteria bacterium]